MTSSLVGSEMCIRDRSSVEEGEKGNDEGEDKKDLLRSLCLARCSCSVSYTHLTLPTICSV
eukprot:11402290-Prorocentrum_lima.AAC.1